MSTYQLKEIATGDLQDAQMLPEWATGIWNCGNYLVADPDGKLYEVVVNIVYPVVSPMTFQMLFTPLEEIAIKKVVDGDPAAEPPVAANQEVAIWWGRLTNPGLTEVDLGLKSVQGALEGLVALGALASDRVAQILTGKLQ